MAVEDSFVYKIKYIIILLLIKMPISIAAYLSLFIFKLKNSTGFIDLLCLNRPKDITSFVVKNQDFFINNHTSFVYQIAINIPSIEIISILSRILNIKSLDAKTLMRYCEVLIICGDYIRFWDTLNAPEVIQKSPRLQYMYYWGALLNGSVSDEGIGKGLESLFLKYNFSLRPHQNLSTRCPGPGTDQDTYVPTSLDYEAGPDGRIYDVANYFAQRLVHAGHGEFCSQVYGKAFAAQDRLIAAGPTLSVEMRAFLNAHSLDIRALRLAPPEWCAQIGHIGMLEILLRMRELGWWSENLIILVDDVRTANWFCVDLFRDKATVIIKGKTVSDALWAEFISLQRYIGFAFGAWRLADGRVVPWQDGGAMALMEWHQKKRGTPFRDNFDARISADHALREAYRAFRKDVGLADGQWFICLHLRDGGYYKESEASGQNHRNTGFREYLDAIKYVHSLGGAVVRLGGPEAQPAPVMEGLIDYARSKHKSDALDLLLIREAKAFLGTTSGLTNMAISLDVPSALVNCITTDAQLWNEKVRFALKPIRAVDGSFLTQYQVTGEKRWVQSSSLVLSQHELVPEANSSDEILETLKQVLDLADGNDLDLKYVEEWKNNLFENHFYGAAVIGSYFYKKYKGSIFKL